MTRNGVLVVSLVAIAMPLGCGSGNKLATVKVDAKVYVDDKPYGPAVLNLSPPTKPTKDTKVKKLPNTTGTVNDDGTTTLKSYPDSVGIVPGTYECNLSQDPMKMKLVPMVSPVTIDIKENEGGKTIDIKFKTVKNARPGMVPPTSTENTSAPMTTNLAPIR